MYKVKLKFSEGREGKLSIKLYCTKSAQKQGLYIVTGMFVLHFHQIKSEIRRTMKDKMNQQYGVNDDVTKSIDKLQEKVSVNHTNCQLQQHVRLQDDCHFSPELSELFCNSIYVKNLIS